METKYIYDPSGNLLAEANSSGQITRIYIYGKGLLATLSSGNLHCYHFNATGSTVAITDGNGTVVNKYAYDPFGKVTGQVEAFSQPFKFVGQFGVMAEPNGFYYMRARYYDPGVGRFVSEDPLGFDGGDVNLYGYVQNNPVMFVDPWGLAMLMVNVNPRGPGSGSITNSDVGHTWVAIVNDNGTSSTIGNYPGGPRDDSSRVPTSSQSWEISHSQADAAFSVMNQPGYNLLTNNCVDRVTAALDAARISHPSLTTLGISDPSKVSAWINNSNNSKKWKP